MSRMRAVRLVLALVIAFPALRGVPAYAWHGSGNITALAIDPQTPTTLYAGTFDRGVFRSTDGGANWSATGLTNAYVTALAVDPQTPSIVYAGTSGSGVFKSADGGGSWSAMNSGLSNLYVADLAIDPQTPTTLYIITSTCWCPDPSAFKTIDGGATWSAVVMPPEGLYATPVVAVTALAIAPHTTGTLYAGVYYVQSPEWAWAEVLKSMDGGASWVSTGVMIWDGYFTALAVDPQTPTTVYVGSYDGSVYKSTAGGAGSGSAPGLTNVTALAIDPLTPTTLYAVIYPGVFKSTDGGTTWSAFDGGLTDFLTAYGVGPGVRPVAIDPLTPTTLYVGTSIGVFKSIDGGASWSPTGLIQHSPLHSLSLNPTSVTGGTASTGTVTLIAPAPAGGAVVTLSSSNTAIATVPASVTVAAGATSASFTVSTSSVTAISTGVISATFDGATRSAVLYVYAQTTLASMSLNPASVTGGTASTGFVSLTTAAPAGGAVVALSSSNPEVATVPASVTVAAGAWNANFSVSTSAVASSTAVTISGTYGDVTRSAVLTVILATTTLASVSLDPTSVTGGIPSTGTVTLSAAAPAGGAMVALTSSNTAVATVPTSVTVTAGATSANFTVSTSVVAASTAVTISGAYGGVTRSAVLTLAPATTTLASVSLNPTSVTGGSPSSGTVILSAAAPAGGAVVALSSSNPAVATVPAGMTIPAGGTSGNFTVLTAGCTSDSVTISGTYGGVTRSAGLTVTLPTATDTVAIQITDYFASKQELRVAAKSTNSTATLRVYVALTGELIGQLANGGDGTFRGQFYWPGNPMSITVRSSLCGSATSAVRAK